MQQQFFNQISFQVVVYIFMCQGRFTASPTCQVRHAVRPSFCDPVRYRDVIQFRYTKCASLSWTCLCNGQLF